MIRLPPVYKRTDALFPHTWLFRSRTGVGHARREAGERVRHSARMPGHVKRRSGRHGIAGVGLFFPHGRVGAALRQQRGMTPAFDDAAVAEHDDFVGVGRSEEHTSEPQSLMRNSYAVFCLKKK